MPVRIHRGHVHRDPRALGPLSGGRRDQGWAVGAGEDDRDGVDLERLAGRPRVVDHLEVERGSGVRDDVIDAEHLPSGRERCGRRAERGPLPHRPDPLPDLELRAARAGGRADPGGEPVPGAGRHPRADPLRGVIDPEGTRDGRALDLERIGSVASARDAGDGGVLVGDPSVGGGLKRRIGDEVAVDPRVRDRRLAGRRHEGREAEALADRPQHGVMVDRVCHREPRLDRTAEEGGENVVVARMVGLVPGEDEKVVRAQRLEHGRNVVRQPRIASRRRAAVHVVAEVGNHERQFGELPVRDVERQVGVGPLVEMVQVPELRPRGVLARVEVVRPTGVGARPGQVLRVGPPPEAGHLAGVAEVLGGERRASHHARVARRALRAARPECDVVGLRRVSDGEGAREYDAARDHARDVRLGHDRVVRAVLHDDDDDVVERGSGRRGAPAHAGERGREGEPPAAPRARRARANRAWRARREAGARLLRHDREVLPPDGVAGFSARRGTVLRLSGDRHTAGSL